MKPAHNEVSLFDASRTFSGLRMINVGCFVKRKILFQRQEYVMNTIMDLLQGPAMILVGFIILISGLMLVSIVFVLLGKMISLKHEISLQLNTKMDQTNAENHPLQPANPENRHVSVQSLHHIEPMASEGLQVNEQMNVGF